MADMGTRKAQELWGYSQETIRKWCEQGIILGATQDKKGSPWHIPANAVCPKPIKKKGGITNEAANM